MSAAIVTGGSTGIGRAIVERLLAAGYEVISLDKNPKTLNVHHVTVDLTDAEATRQAAAEIARSHAVTTLIHNAGAIRPAPLAEVKLEDLNARDVEAAMEVVAGTARSMGVETDL